MTPEQPSSTLSSDNYYKVVYMANTKTSHNLKMLEDEWNKPYLIFNINN